MILIEGTDCSGKETQSKLIMDYLMTKGIESERIGFPDYDSPTGKIIGGPYLGKEYICDGWFPEGAPNVSPKVSALYYGADFLYHLPDMEKTLESGKWIILDRYFYSTFGHQGGKIKDKKERLKMYKWFEKLEFDLLKLKDPDIKIFLHMPYECSVELKKNRAEKADQNEKDADHLKNAEKAYIEVAELYNFETITCGNKEYIKSIDEIHQEIIKVVDKYL